MWIETYLHSYKSINETLKKEKFQSEDFHFGIGLNKQIKNSFLNENLTKLNMTFFRYEIEVLAYFLTGISTLRFAYSLLWVCMVCSTAAISEGGSGVKMEGEVLWHIKIFFYVEHARKAQV